MKHGSGRRWARGKVGVTNAPMHQIVTNLQSGGVTQVTHTVPTQESPGAEATYCTIPHEN